MKFTRRRLLGSAGTLALGAAAIGSVTAQDATTTDRTDLPVYITNVDTEAETITITNVGADPVDLGGYYVDFEYSDPEDDQEFRFPDADVSSIAPGASITVATGYGETGAVDFGSARPIVNDRDPDAVALLNPQGDAVRTSAESAPRRTSTPSDPDGAQANSEAKQDRPATRRSAPEKERTETATPPRSTDDADHGETGC